jgi:hypothetical protein
MHMLILPYILLLYAYVEVTCIMEGCHTVTPTVVLHMVSNVICIHRRQEQYVCIHSVDSKKTSGQGILIHIILTAIHMRTDALSPFDIDALATIHIHTLALRDPIIYMLSLEVHEHIYERRQRT